MYTHTFSMHIRTHAHECETRRGEARRVRAVRVREYASERERTERRGNGRSTLGTACLNAEGFFDTAHAHTTCSTLCSHRYSYLHGRSIRCAAQLQLNKRLLQFIPVTQWRFATHTARRSNEPAKLDVLILSNDALGIERDVR